MANRRRRIQERLHDPPRLLHGVLPGEAGCASRAWPRGAAPRTGWALAALVGELHVEVDRLAVASARRASAVILTPVDGSSLTTSWSGFGARSPVKANRAVAGP